MSITENNARVALGDRLHAEWDATNAEGYDPKLDSGDPKHLNIHLGIYDEDSSHPQLALRDVSGQQTGRAWNADGSGVTFDHGGRIDAQVFAGPEEELPENSQLLAETIGWEAYRIVHNNSLGLTDPYTGDNLVVNLEPLSEPVVRADTDYASVRYFAIVEIGYERRRQTP